MDLTREETDREEEYFLWFQTAHDFAVPSSVKINDVLKQRILQLGRPSKQYLSTLDPKPLKKKTDLKKIGYNSSTSMKVLRPVRETSSHTARLIDGKRKILSNPSVTALALQKRVFRPNSTFDKQPEPVKSTSVE